MALAQMSIQELRKTVKREAERINREVSRAKKAGRKYEILGGLQRFSRAVEKKSRRELVAQYAQMQSKTQGGFIIATEKRITEQREAFARELGVKPSDISPKKLKTLTALSQSAKQNDALFYEALKIGVTYGKYKNFNEWREENRKLDTEKARSEFVTETIRFANKKIRESNKQRAMTGKDALPILRRRMLKASAKKAAKERARGIIGK